MHRSLRIKRSDGKDPFSNTIILFKNYLLLQLIFLGGCVFCPDVVDGAPGQKGEKGSVGALGLKVHMKNMILNQ